MNCCNDLQKIYEGKAVKDIPDLCKKLEKIATDFKNWVSTYKCPRCGQLWIEEYVMRGHGEVPQTYKKNTAVKGT